VPKGLETEVRLTPETIFSIMVIVTKQWGMEQYKGFLIVGSATPNFATGFDWYSQGTILRTGRLGSIIEIKRIRGVIFNGKEAAEQNGLELCKAWIDKQARLVPGSGAIKRQ
jgi:hypothetical protein